MKLTLLWQVNEHIAQRVKEYIKLIEGLFNLTISFEKYHEDKLYVVSVDAIYFVTNKFCKEQGSNHSLVWLEK